MTQPSRSRRRVFVGVFTTIALVMTLATPVSARQRYADVRTDVAPYITLAPGMSRGARLQPIITVGEEINGFMFEGLPDGVGVRPAGDDDRDDDRRDDDRRDHDSDDAVEVYVAHEQTVIPFFNERDFQSSSVSKLTVSTENDRDDDGRRRRGGVLDASVALSPDDGFQRFCSASIAGPDEGLDDYVFFTGEESSERLEDGIQRGFAVVLNTDTGESTAVPGLGRLNHENTIVIPDYDELAMITTDDTFSAGTSQLYMYIAKDQDALFKDKGSLYAFRITHKNGDEVEAGDPFNDANDYLDIGVDDDVAGEFIPVPRDIAVGDQTMLENWSNENNVVQFVRLEDAAVDKKNDRVVYIADTGGSRIQPNPATGRMWRPAGTGLADNGRVFKMVMNDDDPTIVDSLTVLADGDAVGHDKYVPFTSPDNLDTSKKSLMVQEDTDGAAIWQMKLRRGTWREVATVNDPEGESSGIVDVSEWFGGGWWMLTVQAHSTYVKKEVVGENLHKREDGQLLLMKIPGS